MAQTKPEGAPSKQVKFDVCWIKLVLHFAKASQDRKKHLHLWVE